ncbi:MAG TPA: radical SAM protein [Syntrophorhabdaceae bacterium]|nr:radical SAM protein [Syntrophorhabdaceae bacterium]
MKIERIFLLSPPAYTFKSLRDVNPLPPMGLGYLASVIEGMGIQVKILDCLLHGWENEEDVDDLITRVGLSDKEIARYIQDFNPQVVGINCQFSRQYKIYHRMFSIVKESLPDCITIGGGPHTSVCPEEVLQDPNCDYILIGEAEESLKKFIRSLMNGLKFDNIDGLGWKSDGKMIINTKQAWIEDLDSIPFPAYHLMDLERYFGLPFSHGIRHKSRFSPIITSRGCPAHCTFCSADKVWGKRYRVRSIENVIEEMRFLKDTYGIEELMFEDDNVTADNKRAKELFSRMIDERFNFIWDTPNGVGVWSMDNEMIDIMKDSGCIKLNFPVESGSPRVLNKIIKKPLNLSRVEGLIRHCREINLDYGIFLVIGMPGETMDDIWKSFRFAAACDCYNPHISIATPYPGTVLFEECMKNNLFSKEFSLDDLFIRSFMIKTNDWNDKQLRKTIIKGHLLLKYLQFVKHPGSFFRWVIKMAMQPLALISYLKRILFYKN